MKLLIMKFSPIPCHLNRVRSQYSPQHPLWEFNSDINVKKWVCRTSTGLICLTIETMNFLLLQTVGNLLTVELLPNQRVLFHGVG
jgi:hypothetical protein